MRPTPFLAGPAYVAARHAVLALCGAAAACLPAAAQSPPSFFDDFGPPLDTGRWFVSDGWTNGDHQNCTWSQDHLRMEEGHLTLLFSDRARGGEDYSCAEIQSEDRYGYGAFEARLRVPAGSGLNSAFFTFIGAPQDVPHDEIDFEFLGRLPEQVQLNYYTDGQGGHETMVDAAGATEEFRDYAFVWEPGRIQWFIDGELVHEVEAEDVPDQPQKIYLSIWSTDTLTEWMGRLEYPGEPFELAIDWVAYTAPDEPCAFEGSIVCTLAEYD